MEEQTFNTYKGACSYYCKQNSPSHERVAIRFVEVK
jgi:hypothetical protein